MNILLIQKYQPDGVCNFVVDRKDRVVRLKQIFA